ncbi:hypothetical protein [Roseomonas sp. AR75]|uniref:hypothetical protein n=1 Tax=Roseomonas sp. AR75 TaxID=2562311 RepID=UPI0010C0CD82|nr:hypothetical protein [Roseomonas sp. AR75]
MLPSRWDAVNIVVTLFVHGTFAALGCFVMAATWQTAAVNLSVQGVGIVLGFWLGVFLVPMSRKQRQDLSSAAKVVTAFLSGWALSKLDPLATRLVTESVVASELATFRTAAFLCSGLMQALLISLMGWYRVRPMPDFEEGRAEQG